MAVTDIVDPRSYNFEFTSGESESAVIDIQFRHLCAIKFDTADGIPADSYFVFYECDSLKDDSSWLATDPDGSVIVIPTTYAHADATAASDTAFKCIINPAYFTTFNFIKLACVDASGTAVNVTADLTVTPAVREYR